MMLMLMMMMVGLPHESTVPVHQKCFLILILPVSPVGMYAYDMYYNNFIVAFTRIMCAFSVLNN